MSCEGDMCDEYPGFMLFGRRIPVRECQIKANSTTMNNAFKSNSKQTEVEMPRTEKSEQSKNPSDLRDSKQDNVETKSTDEIQKPDKILHCPRCNSLETKFCYFNNYNVKQPRHFCKNCQRYWTAGGTMRNVPVGAGRRKNKHIDPQYRHINPSNDSSSLEPSSVLQFGPEASLNESMDVVLNLINHKTSFDASSINCCTENGEEEVSLCGSSVTNVFTQGNDLSENNRSKSLLCYPFPPLVFPLNPSWNIVASNVQSSRNICNPYSSTDPAAMQWYPTPMMAVPTTCQPTIPVQFVSGSYWHGTASIGSNSCISPASSTSNSCCSGNGTPTLGKHIRDTVEEKSETYVLHPKTLRIDGPNDDSLWTSLGMKQHRNHQFLPECPISKGVSHIL